MISGVFSRLLLIVLAASKTMVESKERENLALKEITKANNAFATSLYTALKPQYPGNLIFSPFSLSTVMAMIRVGAKGNTSYAIDKIFKFPRSKDTLNEGYKTLREYFQNIGGKNFWKNANQVYVQSGFVLDADFKNTLKTYYNYEPVQLNFNNANESAEIINDFFSSTTRGQIQKVFTEDHIPEVNGIILVNAVHFHAHWENRFDPSLTTKDYFHVTPNETVNVDMMNLKADLKYGDIEELSATVVSLPFKAASFSMIVLLPHKEGGLPALEEKLKTYPINEILSELKLSSVNLSLPRFELQSTIDLKIPLSKMGLGIIFDSAKADFSGINPYLFVSKAVQKTFIEMSEEGSVANTAKGIDYYEDRAFIDATLSNLSYYRLKLNRPFITMIYDLPTECVLFFNVISRPNHTKRTKVKSKNRRQLWSNADFEVGFCGVSDGYQGWPFYQEPVWGHVFYRNNHHRGLGTCIWCPVNVHGPFPSNIPQALAQVLSPNQTSSQFSLFTFMIVWTVLLAILASIFAVVFVTTFFNCSKRKMAEKA